MNSKISNYQQYNYNTITDLRNVNITHAKAVNNVSNLNFTSNPINTVQPAVSQAIPNFRAEFISKEEKTKYTDLLNLLDKNGRKELEMLFKNGTLLNSDSNDSSSVLDNLYKIATTDRADGLNNISIVNDTMNILLNPYKITQQFGDIPEAYKDKAVKAFCSEDTDLMKRAIAQNEIDVTHSGTCVAASIEFNMAKKLPAEFTRFVEGLSSPKIAVEKEIKLKNLAESALDAVWLLNAFEVPYEIKDFDKAKLTFKPDKDAIIRAQIQTTHRDPLERSTIDVLMQSTFMQIGSQQSYNSLSDKRAGKFNQNDKGLIEFEKTFTESVVEDKSKLSITYQKVDENARLVGYETDFDTMKRHITDALQMGENVIIGYTQVDTNNIIINGHEITITGTKTNRDGTMTFICNDTDDNISRPIEYHENFLLPKIHHAALPESVVKDDIKLVENWVEGLNTYNEMKKQAA